MTVTVLHEKHRFLGGFSNFLLFLGSLMLVLMVSGALAPAFAAEDGATDSATQANDICNHIKQKSQAMTAARLANNMSYWSQSLKADQANSIKEMRGNVAKKQCLSIKITFFQTIRDLLSGISAIKMAINALINSLLEKVCEYIATAINNVLASVCIPLPSFSLSLSLPSLSATTCDGISLLNVLQMESNTTSSGSSSSKPVIPALDPSQWLNLPLRRGSSSSSGSTE